MQLAKRLEQLGTETAFAVSLAAAEWAAKGNRVFPFHLGDIDLPTPANIVEAMNRAIAEGKTGYCAAAGIAPLREALADNIGGDRGLAYGPNNIVVQPGGKPVITKFIQALMNPGDGVLYPLHVLEEVRDDGLAPGLRGGAGAGAGAGDRTDRQAEHQR